MRNSKEEKEALTIEIEAKTMNRLTYFEIYEVRAEVIKTHEHVTVERYLNKETAERHAAYIRKNLSDCFTTSWVLDQWVFI